jgi:hypothetical protein
MNFAVRSFRQLERLVRQHCSTFENCKLKSDKFIATI